MLSVAIHITTKPGVYIFYHGTKVLYIGKAANLKKRTASYFRKNVGEKVRQMLREATSLDWIETSSEVEAFLKEAELIKKYRPKYNIVLRDDKNYFYVGLTKEKFPKVFISHQLSRNKKANYIGPFTSGTALKITLRTLRRVFPYCACKKPHKRKCLSAQIGKCLGYCCILEPQEGWRDIQILEYNRNIKKIVAVLGGKQKKIVRQIKKEMREAARGQDFEKAAELRDQLSGLENIFSHRLFLTGYRDETSMVPWERIEREVKILAGGPPRARLATGGRKSISRVEGYDISNLLGQEATGSMVVFVDGKPAKNEYRKFKIKWGRQISDVDMLKEIISRRLNHPEWSWPDLMLIDGGKPQLNAALSVLKIKKFWPRTAVIALAKREEELYLPGRRFSIPLKNLPQALAQFLQRIRDESHRFARVYHHKLRQRIFGKK